MVDTIFTITASDSVILTSVPKQAITTINPNTLLILGFAFTLMIMVLLFSAYVLHIGHKSIFAGSGDAPSMAQAILSSLHVTAQFLVGIFAITVLLVCIAQKWMDKQDVIPLVSAIIGYLLGKAFKSDLLGKGKN